MPSRLGVTVIALFWLATTGFVAYRDVLPRYLTDGPPAVTIEMTDEATAQVPARWVLYRETPDGPTKVGGLSSWLEYVAADDTFWFKNEYRDLKFEMGRIPGGELRAEMPKVESDIRMTRQGILKEQRFVTDLEAVLVLTVPFANRDARTPLGGASVELTGTVEKGTLTGLCNVWYPRRQRGPEHVFRPGPEPTFSRPLEPTPVTDGQVLNPMMPLARLRNVRPGRRWVIRETDPLKEAVAALVQETMRTNEQGGKLFALSAPTSTGPRELFAEVRSQPVTLIPYRPMLMPTGRDADPVQCWVIDYRGEGDVRAATWVAVADGRVLRQEASGFGEKLRFERED